jgi:molybdopterin molybdotransferase
MLTAQLRQMGAEPIPLGVARDNQSELAERIAEGLKFEVLVLSGGVSAGKLDLVPSVLAAAGVRQIFHKVRVKPGQPLWFGVLEPPASTSGRTLEGSKDQDGRPRPAPCYVFGLPGNPVSSMVCCELFTRTAIRRMMGIEPATPVPFRARLSSDHCNRGNRPTYHPARWEWCEVGPVVDLVPWIGSADLSATVEANGMALFPEGDQTYPAGTIVDVFSW